MTTISASSAAKINKMNRASKDAPNLGTIVREAQLDILATATAASATQSLAVRTGSLAVSSAQASASAVLVNTGLTAVKGFEVQVFRSGSGISASGINVAITTGCLNIVPSTGATYKVTANDVMNWLAF